MTNLIKYNKSNKLKIKETSWKVLSKNTKTAYQHDFNLFFKVIQKPPSEITEIDILDFIEYLEKEDYKPSSINRKIASLSKMFTVLKMSGEIIENPVSRLRKIKKINNKISRGVIVQVEKKDIKKCLKNKKNYSFYDCRITVLIKVLSTTGLRISEMINIKESDIKKNNEEFHIVRIIGKGKKERFIYFTDELLTEIYNFWPHEHKSGYIFYTKNYNKYCRRYLWRKISERFQEETGKHVRPHLLRHFFITEKIIKEKKNIKAVSMYAGHADISTTLQMYVDTALNEKDAVLKI